MDIKNSTDWPNFFLRRLVSWCCKQSGLPVSKMQLANFRKRNEGYSGHAWSSMRIVCSVGYRGFPTEPDNRPGLQGEIFHDRIEALVAVTAHEIEHCCQYHEGRSHKLKQSGSTETATRVHEVRCLRLFRENRKELLAEWSEPPKHKPKRPATSRQVLNEQRARALLKIWMTKKKLADTKVNNYRTRVRYYERIAAKRATTKA